METKKTVENQFLISILIQYVSVLCIDKKKTSSSLHQYGDFVALKINAIVVQYFDLILFSSLSMLKRKYN